MISEQELDTYRVGNVKVRVIRDALEMNDVLGYVVAWDDSSLLIRKQSRKIVKLSRSYHVQPADWKREAGTDFHERPLSTIPLDGHHVLQLSTANAAGQVSGNVIMLPEEGNTGTHLFSVPSKDSIQELESSALLMLKAFREG